MLDNTTSLQEIELVNHIFEFGFIKVDDVVDADAANSLVVADVIYEKQASDGNIYKFTDSMMETILAKGVQAY